MDKSQFLDTIIDRIHDRDISTIMSEYMPLTARGPHAHGLCPFHSDSRIGSFVVTPSKGMYKCFACGVGGDAISFVAKMKNLNYIEAAFEIALREEIMSHSEYETYLKNTHTTKVGVRTAERLPMASKKIEKKELPPSHLLHQYYSSFLSVMTHGKEGEIRLDDVDREYLMIKRGLTKEVILERGYGTLLMPTKKRLDMYVDDLKGKGLGLSTLQNLPGFFEKKFGEEWGWSFAYSEGIVIPIKNANQEIVAIQIRRRESDDRKSRYFWFSSEFANHNENMKNGTSPGSPMDVLYPDKKPTQALFITEGRFKSEAIVKAFHSTSLSIQGVGNWGGIEEEIQRIQKITLGKHPDFKGYKYIYLAFDSDMKYKYQVYHQLKTMTDLIQEKIPDLRIKYLYWHAPEKGIDDLLAAEADCAVTHILKYDKELWDKSYGRELKLAMGECQKTSPFDLDPEVLKHIEIGETL